MTEIIITLLILTSLIFIGLILIQNPKSTSKVITEKVGAKKANSILTKSTWILSFGVFGMTLILNAIYF